jgi:WD40 repeat protein
MLAQVARIRGPRRAPCEFVKFLVLLTAFGWYTSPAFVAAEPLPAGALVRLGTVHFRQPSVHDLALSPDGKLLASSSASDLEVRLWDVPGGKLLLRIQPANRERGQSAACLAFSPDGKTLYLGEPAAIRFFDTATGKQRGQFPVSLARKLAVAPDGKSLAACQDSGILWLDSATGKVHRKIPLEGISPSIRFFPRGNVLAVASQLTGVHCWDLTTGEQPHQFGTGHSFWDAAVSDDGATLAAAATKGIRRWDLATGKELPLLSTPTTERVEAVAFVPGGKWLVSANNDWEIQMWHLATGKVVHRLRGAPKLAVSNDGRLLAYSFQSGIGFWDLAHGQVRGEGHQSSISALAFAPDGRVLASGGWDNTVRFWDSRTGKELQCWRLPPRPDVYGITGLAYSPDGRQVAVVGDDGTVRLWDSAAGREVRQLSTRPASAVRRSSWADASREVVYSADGKYLYARGERTIRRWETATGRELPAIGAKGSLESMALSPDGKTLVSANNDFLFVHDLNGAAKLRLSERFERCHSSQMAFSADGKMFARAGGHVEHPYILELRDAASGAVRYRISPAVTNSPCFAMAFAGKDGRTLALAPATSTPSESGRANDVILWDLEVVGRLKGHRDRVWKLALAPDGRRLATGSADTTVLIWDLNKAVARKPAARLSPRELNQLWMDLMSNDGPTAYRAQRLLARAEDQVVPFLNDIFTRLLKGGESKRMTALIADLGHEQFKVRDQASRELEELGEFAEPALQQALAGQPTLEFRRRAEKLLDKMGPTRLRLLRAVEVLESLGTADARQVLQLVAEGSPAATLTQQAREAARRLKVRASGP